MANKQKGLAKYLRLVVETYLVLGIAAVLVMGIIKFVEVAGWGGVMAFFITGVALFALVMYWIDQ